MNKSRLIAPGQSLRSITEKITSIALAPRTPQGWMVLMAVAGALVLLLLVSLAVLFLRGIGIWGVNQPVAWGLAIVNFVWWIGIGHAGTLISAILLLFRQRWRNSISRFAEAMTVFAVVCAGLFPVIHLGRPWLFYWLFPYPNSMQMWPQFRSPLLWDVFAVCTYATLSIVFWYVGMIPDFATLRDRAQARPAQIAYGLLSLGWRGSARHWARYETTTLLLAGLATPLVLSVHTVISFDFAVSLLPGWHSTIFPPYFVAGAIYSGMAMVVTLAIPLRRFYKLESLVTRKHIDNMGKIMLTAGLIVAYGYMMEAFMAWYSASPTEAFMMWNRAFGPQAWIYWLLIVCNLIVPLTTLWSRRLRTNLAFMFCLSIVVNVGMWLERFVIVVTSLERDYVPSAWGSYKPTLWDWLTYAGTLGLFLALFLIFVRLLPIVPMNEVRAMLPESRVKEAVR
ncbi:NrfD/PsrC family molybdoenzyme membrane anchor subunit [Telmatobacter bradus]|uniref:NrfD/PsrC family molybdoenzyme membrane anchor subunit n=1 Tax=Telmatobacter bradus TaxID=474953 RepID=UPI003B431486